MPNRCENYVKIEAKPKVIKTIKKTIKKKSWFENFHPMPEELKIFTSPPQKEFGENDALFKQRIIRHKKLYGAESWYDRAYKNRGTKRDVEPRILREKDTSIDLYFDTAWGPPTEALLKLTEIYKGTLIIHKFSEEGNYFSGIYEYKDGEIINKKDFNDPYFGEGKMCEECGRKYDPDNEEMRYDEDQTICVYCGEK